MDYENFKEQFVEDVRDRLYELSADVDLSIHTVNKLNESYEAITVTPKGSNIGVNIGIDKFYDAVESGKSYDEVVDKYLGYPYVWGSSSPSTSFDCSGFVSYVINHCGNGWNYGRLTADGWKNATARVSASDVKPGDLFSSRELMIHLAPVMWGL